MINTLMDAFQNVPGIIDNWRVAIGQPDRAGLYTTVAVAINRNYNPGVGVGVLLVKMRLFGVSLAWNNNNTSYTVDQLAKADLGAQAFYNGAAVNQRVRYAYVGITSESKPFLGGDTPTEAGRYLQTAFTLGGNYITLPIVRIVTVTA